MTVQEAVSTHRLDVLVVVEGNSDLEFFPAVLTSLLRDVLQGRGLRAQGDAHVTVLGSGSAHRATRLAELQRRSYPDARVVAVHVDGSTDPGRELRKAFSPIAARWPKDAGELIALVPVREMEAWALADLGVVREALGVDWDVSRVRDGGLLSQPERLPHPKETLGDVLAQAVRPRRRPRPASSYLPFIAENVPLASLRRLESFRAFEQDLRRAIDHPRDEESE